MNQHTTTCPACDSDWIKRRHRSVWEKLLHGNEKKYQCERCDKTFFIHRTKSATDPESEAIQQRD